MRTLVDRVVTCEGLGHFGAARNAQDLNCTLKAQA